MALTTALHILTGQPGAPDTEAGRLAHRTTDKQPYDLQEKKLIAKVTYDKDRGVLALIARGDLVDTLRNYWHEAWKEVHKDHPRYPSDNRYPHAMTFAAAGLEDEKPSTAEEGLPAASHSSNSTKQRTLRLQTHKKSKQVQQTHRCRQQVSRHRSPIRPGVRQHKRQHERQQDLRQQLRVKSHPESGKECYLEERQDKPSPPSGAKSARRPHIPGQGHLG